MIDFILFIKLGRTLSLEGLFLSLMRLGSIVGGSLPKRSPIAVVLGFGLIKRIHRCSASGLIR